MDRKVAVLIQQMRRQARKGADGKILLSDLARTVRLSERRAQQLLRQHVGKTFRALRKERQMKLARRLLRLTFAPVKEIAYRAGYQNLAAFCREFRRRQGCTPTQYRNTPAQGLQ